jgi:CheY-like chemotaxis protein
MRSRKPVILLVEDNPADAGLVREALEEHGVECDLILMSDGETAIEFVEYLDAGVVGCPELVILDLNLPRRTGQEVLAQIRSSTICANVPVVILSSSDGQRDRDNAARLGASEYLRKPSRLNEFIELGAIFKKMLTPSY